MANERDIVDGLPGSKGSGRGTWAKAAAVAGVGMAIAAVTGTMATRAFHDGSGTGYGTGYVVSRQQCIRTMSEPGNVVRLGGSESQLETGMTTERAEEACPKGSVKITIVMP